MRLETRQEVEALFLTAGLPVQKVWELPNGYWPEHPDYAEMRAQTPWWLVQTAIGLVQVGWRKRVMDIDWSGTSIRTIVTEDDVTKNEEHVHAWSNDKAVAYLITLRRQDEQRRLEIQGPVTVDYELPDDLVEMAMRRITRLYGESEEAKALDVKTRESQAGDAVRMAMRATLSRASKDLQKAPEALT